MSYSQRMSANNDGMDPDWRPDPVVPEKIDAIDKVKKLYDTAAYIVDRYQGISDEDLDNNDYVLKVTMTTRQWLDLRKLIESIKGV